MPRGSLLWGLGPRIEPVFPNFGEEGRAGNSQHVSCTSFVAASEFEGLGNVLTFHGFQGLGFGRLLGTERRPERPQSEVWNRQINYQEIQPRYREGAGGIRPALHNYRYVSFNFQRPD